MPDTQGVEIVFNLQTKSLFAFWCLSRDAVGIEFIGLKRCLFISGSPTSTASENE